MVSREKDFYGHFSKFIYAANVLSIEQFLLAYNVSKCKAREKI